jgi:outer membrane protein assembly factor BamE (lipoprotein component of BamABCDE complex)
MKAIIALLPALLLLGCAGMPISEKNVSHVQIGKTTKEELLYFCGTPRYEGMKSGPEGTREKLTWIYQPTKQNAAILFGITSPLAQSITFIIGTNGIVESFEVENNEPRGPGRR